MRRSWRHGTGAPHLAIAHLAIACLAVALAMLCLPAGALAQDADAASGWSFQVTPYLWLAGIGGNVSTARGLSASFSQSIGDVLSELDGGLMLLGEARYGR